MKCHFKVGDEVISKFWKTKSLIDYDFVPVVITKIIPYENGMFECYYINKHGDRDWGFAHNFVLYNPSKLEKAMK